ncbi:MAG: TraB/GumN family protein [Gammaproteobacteria bacterium]
MQFISRWIARSILTMLVLFLCSGTGMAAGEHTDRSQGLLWEISRPGLATSHLFGTLHLEHPDVLRLPGPVQGAFDDARQVVLEVLLDTDAMIYASSAMLLTDGRQLSGIIGSVLFIRASQALQARGIPALVLERMQPWAAAVTLSLPAQGSGQVLDMALYQQALQAGKPVAGLETIREQLDVFATLSESDQVALLEEAVGQSAEIDAIHAQLLAAWLRRDLAALQAINEDMQAGVDQRLAEDFQRRVLHDRNRRMAERLQPYLQQGHAFIAVGALHLPGAQGLLNRLAQRGYTVRVIY